MKKCTIILLLFSILLNTTGYLFFFLELKKQNRKDILKKISSVVSDKELVKIRMSKASLPGWSTEDEFQHNGNYYDVVRYEEKGNDVIFYCINDEKEKELYNALNKHTDQNKNTSRNSSSLYGHLSFLTGVLNKNFTLPKEHNLFGKVMITNLIYSSVISEIDSPPPRNSFI